MNISDFDEEDQLQPQNPINKVFLVGHPKYIKTDKGVSIDFTFRDVKKPASRTFKFFDIFNPKEDANEKLVAANKRSLTAMFLAIMTPEAQDQWKQAKPSNLEEFYNSAIPFIDPNIANVELELLFGYSTQGKGYIQLPGFGSVISSKHRERSLVRDPNSLTITPSKRKAPKADDDDDESHNNADI